MRRRTMAVCVLCSEHPRRLSTESNTVDGGEGNIARLSTLVATKWFTDSREAKRMTYLGLHASRAAGRGVSRLIGCRSEWNVQGINSG